MKKITLLTLSIFSLSLMHSQNFVGTDKTVISFYSHTSMEDIAATNTLTKAVVLKSETGEFIAQVSNKAFVFKSGLMQEHFNENYMETDKFQYSTFKGKVVEKIDYSKDGTYKITMDGILDVHGVKKPRKIEGTMVIKGDIITIESKFTVAMKDHDIKIPEAVGNKFAEAMELTVKAELKKK